MPTVSVVMPAYNSSKFISEAIESVINQIYKDLEVIVIDDGSTDNTFAIINEYAKLYGNKVRYLYQANSGPATARNKGIKEASGEYIAFLDGDDIWLPEKLELQISKLMANPEYRFVHTNRFRINIEGSVGQAKHYNAPEGMVFNELLKRNFICTSSVLIKRECFKEAGFFDENRNNKSEDYDMWLRIARRYKIGFLCQPLVKYRVNFAGYNRSNIKNAYDSERDVFLKALEHYDGDKESFKKTRLHSMMRRMGDSLFDAKEYGQASRAFADAVKRDFIDFRSAGFYVISKLLEAVKT